MKLSNLVKEHLEELAQLESRNGGKPISGARGEVLGASLVFEYYAGAANKVFGETIPVSKPGLDFTLREPIGVVGLFGQATRNVKVGDPADEATEMGSLISFKQRDRVLDYIGIGRDEGAELVVGGTAPEGEVFAGGAYVLPTVFDNARNDMRICAEEIFGPVVSIIPFDTEEEAVRMANDTPYGLSGSIWSRDIGRALRVAKGIP